VRSRNFRLARSTIADVIYNCVELMQMRQMLGSKSHVGGALQDWLLVRAKSLHQAG
jgi:hypothetical protein